MIKNIFNSYCTTKSFLNKKLPSTISSSHAGTATSFFELLNILRNIARTLSVTTDLDTTVSNIFVHYYSRDKAFLKQKQFLFFLSDSESTKVSKNISLTVTKSLFSCSEEETIVNF